MNRDEWFAADPRRFAPEVDLGTRWTREDDDALHRLSWNTGSGELYLTDTSTNQIVAGLGAWPSVDAVRNAFPDVDRRAARPGGIYYLAAQAEQVLHEGGWTTVADPLQLEPRPLPLLNAPGLDR